jgi:predicted DNA-binding transcriptional regulator YafY
MRPGPRSVIAAGVLPTLRRAILGMQLVVIRYAGPNTEESATRILSPYGLLYGGRGWLVAHVDGLPEMRLWRLDRIVSADLLDRGFQRREDFDLSAYAAQSFGVFQEEPIDVVLRFSPEAADDAASWLFHPSQSIAREPDRALTVRFRAGGVQEMCWHLFTWGTTVSIVSPPTYRNRRLSTNNSTPSRVARDQSVNYRLDRMNDVRVTDTPGTQPRDFSIDAYASRSFDVFQGEPHDVVLRFIPPKSPTRSPRSSFTRRRRSCASPTARRSCASAPVACARWLGIYLRRGRR